MKLLIYGCGYVGSAVAEHAKKENIRIITTTRNEKRVKELEQVSDEVILIQQTERLISAIQNCDVILFSVGASGTQTYREAYLHNAQFITSSIQQSKKVQPIIYTSSTSVYGDCNGNTVTENWPEKPTNENTAILLETEKQLMTLQKRGINVCIYRIGQITGPNRKISERLKKLNAPLPGNGQNPLNIIDRENIVRAITFAYQNRLNGVYNLVRDEHPSRKQFYESLAKKHKFPTPKWDPKIKSTHGGNRIVSNDKIKLSGFIFKHSAID